MAVQVIGAGLVDKVVLEQIPKAMRWSVMWISGKSITGRGNSQYNGPEGRDISAVLLLME